LVVEGIGFVSITTALDIYEANQAGQAKDPSRSIYDGAFWVAVSGTAMYLTAVLMVNAILHGGDGWQKLTLGLLSLFGVIGGVMVALRNQLHKRRVATLASDRLAEERERQDREHAWKLDEERLRMEHEERLRKIDSQAALRRAKVDAESLRKSSDQSPAAAGEQPVGVRRWPEVPESDWKWIASAPAQEIVKKYRIQGKDPERQARTWKKYAKEAHRGKS
jgi:hypothetical protein